MADPRSDQAIDNMPVDANSDKTPSSHRWAKFTFCVVMAAISFVALLAEHPKFNNHRDWQNLGGAFGFSALSVDQWLNLRNRGIETDSRVIRLLFRVLLGPTAIILLGFVVYYVVLAFAWMRSQLA
jgi:hypothetical protein